MKRNWHHGAAANRRTVHRDIDLPDIGLVSAKVYDAWIAGKRAQNVTSRKSETGEELMVPYDHLSERAKELDRQTVLAVYAAIQAAV